MSKIIFLRGLPASGKSTWAKAWVNEDSGHRYRANKDDLRLEYPNWSEKQIVQEETARVKLALLSGRDVVVDDTNFNPVHEERFRELAKHIELINEPIDFEVKEFNIDPLTAIERDSKREKPIGKKAIIDMYKKYIYKEPCANIEATGKIILCDIDGTVAYKCDRDIYDYTKVSGDYANMKLFKILELLSNAGFAVCFLSGREDNCKEETQQWIASHFNKPFMLAMRKAGDKRDDTIVKAEIFDAHFKPSDIFCVFDDRPKVVRMWKNKGLYVFGCNQEPYDLPF